jgi:hypothetical protein
MERWWLDTDKGKPKYSEENLSHCHFVHDISQVQWPGIEPVVTTITAVRERH